MSEILEAAPLGVAALAEHVLPSVRAVTAEMVQLRRHLHAHPEIAYEEHATSDLVASRLAAWGYEAHRGLAGTGVVGTLKRGRGTRRLGLRADMDALPIHEATGLPYASRHAGKMHACGHDGHTAMRFARDVALEWPGESGLVPDLQPVTGSEDFSFMLEHCPGSYLVVGNGVGETHGSGGCSVHNPGYDFNDAILPVAASYWVRPARRFLAPQA